MGQYAFAKNGGSQQFFPGTIRLVKSITTTQNFTIQVVAEIGAVQDEATYFDQNTGIGDYNVVGATATRVQTLTMMPDQQTYDIGITIYDDGFSVTGREMAMLSSSQSPQSMAPFESGAHHTTLLVINDVPGRGEFSLAICHAYC